MDEMTVLDEAMIALDCLWATYDPTTNVVTLGLTDNDVNTDGLTYLVYEQNGLKRCSVYDELSNEIGALAATEVTDEQIVILLATVLGLKEQAAE